MKLVCLVVCALALSACATETVMLRNAGGQTVQCGPYASSSSAEQRLVADIRLRDCVMDFQRQGYERVGG